MGLTGGIASGKSTVADLFAELGVDIIDTDVIAREIVEPGMPALDAIRREFGDAVINDDGGLDRGRMRRIVFADEARRRKLEELLHPRIRAEADRQSEASDSAYHIVVVPLLTESPMRDEMDRVLVVDCDEATQLRRLLARDAESPDQARRMIDAQVSREARLAIADDVVSNDGDLVATRRQVERLHRKYLDLAQAKADR
ncbi:MAG: dephospho-CoA kinase [Woeseiaceae bacterium]|nr:dephospho-CoA kinase [Woeseiaceae bacterium]